MTVKARRYGKVAVGGTFDKFHKGHRKLLEKALEVGDAVLIGVTTERMLEKNPKPHEVDSFSERVREIKAFLEEKKVMERVVILPLDDPYGPTLTDEEIEVIVVSLRTASRAREINRLRRERGLKPLKVMIVDTVLAEDGNPISTNRVRRGEIDREGRLLT